MTHRSILATVLIGLSSVNVNAKDRAEADWTAALRQYDAAPDAIAKARCATAIDATAHQKDAAVSRLFWHTDLNEALSESASTHRPVLSLRLLGRLDEELSCANSRFFRTTLYANERVADVLRTQFVLHWQSVRPAPKLTIDFGDGRTMVTTVTGNSIHYVLDEKDNVVDALPGMYSPATFVARISAGAKLAQQGLENRHGAWAAALQAAGLPGGSARSNRDAVAAGRLAISKSVVQSTAVGTITGSPIVTLPLAVTDTAIRAITFDRPSLELMRHKMPDDWSVDAVDTALANLRRTIAQDEALNDTRLRPIILRHLSMNPTEPVAVLNDWVYANVFLTPRDDKWLGLANADRFNGIENGGLAVETRKP